MRCPEDNKATRVVDCRTNAAGNKKRRRRECSVCGHRFTTWETIDDSATRKVNIAIVETHLRQAAARVAPDIVAALLDEESDDQ